MAEAITVRMMVGSHLPLGGDNPVTQLGMMALGVPGNVEVLGPNPRADVSVLVKDELVAGIGLGKEYDVTFTPVE